MTDSIKEWMAVILFAISLFISWRKSRNKKDTDNTTTNAVQDNKIDNLSDKFDIKFESLRTEIRTDIKHLSNRVDKHNDVCKRMIAVEQSTKSAHHRIDDINRATK